LVLNDFVVSASLNRKIEILSDGSPFRPLIHVKDMARAIEWASIRKSRQGGIFLVVNAGSNAWNYRIKELAENVRDILGDVELSINTSAASDTRSYKVDFSLFRDLAPEFAPTMTLDETVMELVDGIKNIKFQNKNFRDSIYVRLNTLTNLRERKMLNINLKWNNT
jgi:nucleoside-diphosphate-sugar epimerase